MAALARCFSYRPADGNATDDSAFGLSQGSLARRALNGIVTEAVNALFRQAELAELTYGALDIAATTVQNSEEAEIKISYPLGWRPDRQPIRGEWSYPKEQLINKYKYLAFHQLAVNGLFQLVAITEAMLGDIVRALVRKYPQKLGGKRSIAIQTVLECSTIDDIHIRATDSLLNELSYKSPAEFAEALLALISINLFECPAFHKYMEIKASRDIFIHNRGVANETYIRKAGTHQRVNAGTSLPADIQYFLESYEACLQLCEWLERELHQRWHSPAFEARKQPQLPLNPDEPPAA
jgi:hypothetical protein